MEHGNKSLVLGRWWLVVARRCMGFWRRLTCLNYCPSCPTSKDQRLNLQFVLRPRRLGPRLGGQIEYQFFKHQALAGRIGTQGEVGLANEPDGACEFTLRLVAPGLADDVLGGKRWNAEALPERGPQGALVAHIALEDYQHLPKSF